MNALHRVRVWDGVEWERDLSLSPLPLLEQSRMVFRMLCCLSVDMSVLVSAASHPPAPAQVLLLLLPADTVAEAANPTAGVVNSPSPALTQQLARRDVAERVRGVASIKGAECESLLMLAADIAHLAVVPTTQAEAR
jgi:hypothetical protein